MSDVKNLRTSTHKFVTDALTKSEGKRPSKSKINHAVNKIVKAFLPIVSAGQSIAENPKS